MSRQGRPGKEVFMFDTDGKLMVRYRSINQAAEANNMTVNSVNYYIRLSRSYNGIRFSLSETLAPEEPKGRKEYPWEKDGIFDVKGWATVCI